MGSQSVRREWWKWKRLWQRIENGLKVSPGEDSLRRANELSCDLLFPHPRPHFPKHERQRDANSQIRAEVRQAARTLSKIKHRSINGKYG